VYVRVRNIYARTVALLSPVITLVFALALHHQTEKTLEYLEDREHAARKAATRSRRSVRLIRIDPVSDREMERAIELCADRANSIET